LEVFEQGAQADQCEHREQIVEDHHGGYTLSQRRPANCCSMASSMRWTNLASGYSALQPVQRKTTARHVRFSARGVRQFSHMGFFAMVCSLVSNQMPFSIE
jgi:hypothetical protein